MKPKLGNGLCLGGGGLYGGVAVAMGAAGAPPPPPYPRPADSIFGETTGAIRTKNSIGDSRQPLGMVSEDRCEIGRRDESAPGNRGKLLTTE